MAPHEHTSDKQAYFAWGDISVFSGAITMKLCTNIRHVSGQRWKCFQGHRSKVKVTTRPNAVMVEAYMAWRLSCCNINYWDVLINFSLILTAAGTYHKRPILTWWTLIINQTTWSVWPSLQLILLIGRVSYLIYVSMRHYALTTSGDIVVCFHTAVCLTC